MSNENYVKGIIFAIISLLLVSLQPIVANSRPKVIDVYIFAAMTCIIEAIIFLPLVIIERKKIKRSFENKLLNFNEMYSLLYGYKKRKNAALLLYIGINFAIAQVLFFAAYQIAGAINGSLAQQTTIIFALLFGFLINHEKISKIQIIFVFVLLFGLTLAITQGNFNLLEFNLGVLLMMITTLLWMLAHTLVKPLLENNEITSTQLVFIRNALSGLILILTYFLFFPIENVTLLFDSTNQFFFIIMGIIYGFDVFCWYLSLKYISVSKTTILVSPMPILTAIFAYLILGESFTIFHLIGTIIIMVSIMIIIREKEEKKTLDTES